MYKEEHKQTNKYKAYRKHQWNIPNIIKNISFYNPKAQQPEGNKHRDKENSETHKEKTLEMSCPLLTM